MARKRARSSSDSDEEEEEEELPSAGRDENYYDEDGDCVIRVENVLFKTHRVFLARGSPVLADMFALPQGEQPAEGATDEDAIFLAGDTPQQFRAFLRYSLAPALANQFDRIPVEDILTVLDLAHFAQKYMMASWVEYAVAAIQYFCRQPNAASNTGLSLEVLRSTLTLAATSPQAAELWTDIPHVWKLRLKTHPRLEYCDALDAAEAVGPLSREFLIDLYYAILCRIRMPPYHWTSTATQFPYPRVAPVHLARILMGYWSLTVMWLHLSKNPPKLPCGTQHRTCAENWEKAWVEMIHHPHLDEFNPADVIARLWAMEKRARHTLTNSCADRLLDGENNPFRRVRLEVMDSLAERFFGTEDFALFRPLGPPSA
ncbi:hypothetical protein FB45DRAFT_901656 [Roridomyces roridus]|uniref:BTB domain-containing protein n=1 Tax=Roridomyces roridus TaxID=1738132 RepID=A0AAD7C923_9AGAR|nr:hypothetical protein FB45DRAFT_901656 [Roridomyces roridus]